MVIHGVTGADGFIGQYVCRALEEQDHIVKRIVRKKNGPGSERFVVSDLAQSPDLEALLKGVDALIHVAGRAHVLRETELVPAAAFQRANVETTMRVAEAATRAGVRRLVFVSSIGVNGNETRGRPFLESDTPAPVEPYAESKLRAELWLRSFCADRSLELVVVRPPLVYGPGAPGNFRRLLNLAASGLPLPVAAVNNRRNLIGVENLADFLVLCANHPAAAGETFLAAEPDVHSTPELIGALADALKRPNRLFKVPVGLLRACATAIGRRAEFDKFCGSLEVSSAKAAEVLGWTPTRSFADGIAKAAAAYSTQGQG